MTRGNIRKNIEKILEMLRNLKAENPGSFEYIFQGAIYNKNDEALNVSSFNLIEASNFDYYYKQMALEYNFRAEIKRFDMLKWAKVCRVVCVEDSLPPDLDPKKVEIRQWVQRLVKYRLVGVNANYEERQLSLHLETLDGEAIVPPFPYDGFSSKRFVLDDYTKLN